MDGSGPPALPEAKRTRLSWRSHATVYRPAEPPVRPKEICGVVSARASLRRVRRGWRGQVRLWVKPSAIDEAVDAALTGEVPTGGLNAT